jgi:ABC-2 type transport system ATP-binding protein
VLHQGKVLAHDQVARVIAANGAQDVNAAFARLTAAVAEKGSSAS